MKEKEIVLITGANGLVASHLSIKLKDKYTLRYLTRKKREKNHFLWDIPNRKIEAEALNGIKHIVHLAGTNIAEKKWTPSQKKNLYESRVIGAELMFEVLEKKNIFVDTFISASGTNYYPLDPNVIYTESHQAGNAFLSKLCQDWETSGERFYRKRRAKRVVFLRTGMVLAKGKGALKPLEKIIKHRLISILGDGNQFVPWIHLEDLCQMYLYLLENPNAKGAYNAVAPDFIKHKDFIKQLTRILNRKIILPNIPPFFIRAILGEMSSLILEGARVSPQKIIDQGFDFHFDNFQKAINNLYI